MLQFSRPSEIIDLWPSREAMALDLSRPGDPVTAARVHRWAFRGSIPGRYWRRIVQVAARRGYPVTLDDLALIADPAPDLAEGWAT